MDKEEIKQLIARYHAGKCDPEEIAFIESWYNQWNDKLPFGLSSLELGTDLLLIKQNVLSSKPNPSTPSLWSHFIKIAAAIAIITLGTWLYLSYTPLSNQSDLQHATANIAPGKNTATLMLANGKTINLSATKTGLVIKSNSLTYNDGSAMLNAEELRNNNVYQKNALLIASTPLGGTYQVTLPDGTKVWLNAATTLKFPATFSGLANRKIELIGEAYFEVSKNKNQPFIVNANHMALTVLGTHFNVNAYADDTGPAATLLEGSIKVYPSNQVQHSALLKPGQQANLIGNIISVHPVDVNQAIAWKEGKFSFYREEVGSIMKKISRWYNVSVFYKDGADKIKFTGTISRYEKIYRVIEMLQSTGELKFKVADRNIYISK
ncbi:fec operon regulator FecR [compost metagenome]